MLSRDFKEFVELLIKNKAEYLVVGGYAVAIHGYPRYTGDLDIWLNPTPENAKSMSLGQLMNLDFHLLISQNQILQNPET
jgi:hypothetical protein